MRYIVLYLDGSMTFYSKIPSEDDIGMESTVYIASSQTTVQDITKWISGNYSDTNYIKRLVEQG